MYTGKQDLKTFSVFSPQVVFTLPNGDVVVGHSAMGDKFSAIVSQAQDIPAVHQRLLQTPESLPARTMCIDQVVTYNVVEHQQPSTRSIRTLIVLKRRATDGLVTTFTEEEGHRRVSGLAGIRSMTILMYAGVIFAGDRPACRSCCCRKQLLFAY